MLLKRYLTHSLILRKYTQFSSYIILLFFLRTDSIQVERIMYAENAFCVQNMMQCVRWVIDDTIEIFDNLGFRTEVNGCSHFQKVCNVVKEPVYVCARARVGIFV